MKAVQPCRLPSTCRVRRRSGTSPDRNGRQRGHRAASPQAQASAQGRRAISPAYARSPAITTQTATSTNAPATSPGSDLVRDVVIAGPRHASTFALAFAPVRGRLAGFRRPHRQQDDVAGEAGHLRPLALVAVLVLPIPRPETPRDVDQILLPEAAPVLGEPVRLPHDDIMPFGFVSPLVAFGLAFEGYGPVGERRVSDLAGRLVDAIAEFPDGGEGDGLLGVQTYIREHRQDDYLDNLSRKMLAYALSRSLQLSDDPIIEQAQANLKANDFRFASLIETIVTSPQFINRRDPDPAAQRSFVPKRGE